MAAIHPNARQRSTHSVGTSNVRHSTDTYVETNAWYESVFTPWGPPYQTPWYCTRCLAPMQERPAHCARCGSSRITIGPIPAIRYSEGPLPRRDHPLPPRATPAPGRHVRRNRRRRPVGPNRRRKNASETS